MDLRYLRSEYRNVRAGLIITRFTFFAVIGTNNNTNTRTRLGQNLPPLVNSCINGEMQSTRDVEGGHDCL